MLRDAVLLKLLAKLLTICVIFADQTRIVMADVAVELAASPLPPSGHSRRERLRELSDPGGLLVHVHGCAVSLSLTLSLPLLSLLSSAAVDSLARSLVGGLDAEWSGAAASCVALDGLLPHANAAKASATLAKPWQMPRAKRPRLLLRGLRPRRAILRR